MKCVYGSLVSSNVYVPIIIVSGCVAFIALIAWPIAIVLQKFGLLGGIIGQHAASHGIIGSAPFASHKFIHMKVPQHDL